ncbi:MAG: SDR family NAD(P)-dependent oxidoreductase, partial [Chloroflexota bacterium]
MKIAIVTGAGSGIGRATAVSLTEAGFHVVLVGRRVDALEETAVLAKSTHCLVVPSDIAKPESVQALFAKTWETYGRLDLLFNNAGIGAPGVPLEEISFDQWQA